MTRSRYAWLVGWVLWSMGAGALAGVGLVEFNWGGPPYDGGFLGELALFGGFLAFGQAPFVAVFVSALHRRATGGLRDGYLVAVLSVLLWPVVGFVGWTMGSYLEVGLATPLYSIEGVLAGAMPWTIVGTLEAAVLVAALISVRRPRATGGSAPTRSTGGLETSLVCGLVWISASAVGGLLYEYWVSFDIAARQNPLNYALGSRLEGAGVAENVAFGVVPTALAVPLLYGIPTGLGLCVVHRLVTRAAPQAA